MKLFPPPRGKAPERRIFLVVATVFEGMLVALAVGLGWLVSVDPFQDLSLTWEGLGYGIAGTFPLHLAFRWSYCSRVPGMQSIRQFLMENLGPLLAALGPLQRVYLGFLAGISEEILFRGFFQNWFEANWGWFGGLLFSNLIFALAHWITPLYALLAGLTGVYLGLAFDFLGERNLLIPLLIHSLFDVMAFFAIANGFRRELLLRA